MSFDHRIDLLSRIERLETLKEDTKRHLAHGDKEDGLDYHVRYNNCVYLIGLYKHRLELLEHHIEEERVGLL